MQKQLFFVRFYEMHARPQIAFAFIPNGKMAEYYRSLFDYSHQV